MQDFHAAAEQIEHASLQEQVAEIVRLLPWLSPEWAPPVEAAASPAHESAGQPPCCAACSG